MRMGLMQIAGFMSEATIEVGPAIWDCREKCWQGGREQWVHQAWVLHDIK